MTKIQYFILGLIVMWLIYIIPEAIVNFIIGYNQFGLTWPF